MQNFKVELSPPIDPEKSKNITSINHPLRESPNQFTKFQKFFRKKKSNFYVAPPAPSGKKTLVLDLDETLIHSSSFPPHQLIQYFTILDDSIQIDSENTNADSTKSPQLIYIFLRPGLDEFLEYAKENFEVFVYTYAERNYAEPILDKILPDLDENHRLYRDSCITVSSPSSLTTYTSYYKLTAQDKNGICKNKKGKYSGVIKDLLMLKRNMSDVIFVDDNNYQAIRANSENTIVIPCWKGIPNDSALVSWLVPLLRNCLTASDVRDVIKEVDCKCRRYTL